MAHLFFLILLNTSRGQKRRDESEMRVEERGDRKASQGARFLAMEFKSLYSEIKDTQVDVLHQDVSVHQPSALSDHLRGSTSMNVDVERVETELNVFTRVLHVAGCKGRYKVV